jgi:hypothetical protein
MWLIVDARILLGSVVAGEFFASLLGLHPAASQAFRCCRHRLGIRAKRSSRLPSVAFFDWIKAASIKIYGKIKKFLTPSYRLFNSAPLRLFLFCEIYVATF